MNSRPPGRTKTLWIPSLSTELPHSCARARILPSVSNRSRWPIVSEIARKVSSGERWGKRAWVTSQVVCAPLHMASNILALRF